MVLPWPTPTLAPVIGTLASRSPPSSEQRRRGLSALALILALPLASAHLNPNEMGVWTLLVTAVALLGFADLGLSNGLLNALSEAVGRDDRLAARQAITAAFVGLSGLAIVGGSVAAILVPRISWEGILHTAPGQVSDLPLAIGAFLGLVLLTIPAGMGQRVHMAYQQAWAAAAVNGVGSILSLAGVVVCAATDASLVWFVAAMLGGTAVVFAGETAWVLGRSHRDLRPRRADLDLRVLGRLVRTGILFFLLAAAGATAYQSDSLVISHYLGAAEVTQFAVAARLFLLAPGLLTAVLMPLWPAYGEAAARQDQRWIRSTLRRSLLGSLGVSAAVSLVMLVGARPVLRVWSPHTATPSTGLLVALTLWAIVSSFSTALGVFLNGVNVIRFQVVVAVMMATTNLVLSIALVGPLGSAGPIWASVVTQSMIVVLPIMAMIGPALRSSARTPRTWQLDLVGDLPHRVGSPSW